MCPQFVDDMHVSAKDGFRENGFSERIVDELVLATLTANYGQSTTVHKFVGKSDWIKIVGLKSVFFVFLAYTVLSEHTWDTQI
jgi:hypothetical protein